ncbi:uncharacterized protein BJ171DRAFT_122414 [Polychytrium aggregatum]|uniref:uncharacterized protein n=1 Tax=Polychytrium aggregatum TaxID=110093 RepID=UPI0022FF0368|nr:uncharacterized protein BJ171DRAFT_122414 [Polychytrium aggregatum]KAI9204288.1 hypothetical protein BJ171DRAFT_122414 [Polychytrium aggregatum]
MSKDSIMFHSLLESIAFQSGDRLGQTNWRLLSVRAGDDGQTEGSSIEIVKADPDELFDESEYSASDDDNDDGTAPNEAVKLISQAPSSALAGFVPAPCSDDKPEPNVDLLTLRKRFSDLLRRLSQYCGLMHSSPSITVADFWLERKHQFGELINFFLDIYEQFQMLNQNLSSGRMVKRPVRGADSHGHSQHLHCVATVLLDLMMCKRAIGTLELYQAVARIETELTAPKFHYASFRGVGVMYEGHAADIQFDISKAAQSFERALGYAREAEALLGTSIEWASVCELDLFKTLSWLCVLFRLTNQVTSLEITTKQMKQVNSTMCEIALREAHALILQNYPKPADASAPATQSASEPLSRPDPVQPRPKDQPPQRRVTFAKVLAVDIDDELEDRASTETASDDDPQPVPNASPKPLRSALRTNGKYSSTPSRSPWAHLSDTARLARGNLFQLFSIKNTGHVSDAPPPPENATVPPRSSTGGSRATRFLSAGQKYRFPSLDSLRRAWESQFAADSLLPYHHKPRDLRPVFVLLLPAIASSAEYAAEHSYNLYFARHYFAQCEFEARTLRIGSASVEYAIRQSDILSRPGSLEMSLAHWRLCLQHQMGTHGPGHPKLIPIFIRVAEIVNQQARKDPTLYRTSIDLANEALRQCMRAASSNTMLLTKITLHLSDTLVRSNQLTAAIENLQKAELMLIQRAGLRSRHPVDAPDPHRAVGAVDQDEVCMILVYSLMADCYRQTTHSAALRGIVIDRIRALCRELENQDHREHLHWQHSPAHQQQQQQHRQQPYHNVGRHTVHPSETQGLLSPELAGQSSDPTKTWRLHLPKISSKWMQQRKRGDSDRTQYVRARQRDRLDWMLVAAVAGLALDYILMHNNEAAERCVRDEIMRRKSEHQSWFRPASGAEYPDTRPSAAGPGRLSPPMGQPASLSSEASVRAHRSLSGYVASMSGHKIALDFALRTRLQSDRVCHIKSTLVFLGSLLDDIRSNRILDTERYREGLQRTPWTVLYASAHVAPTLLRHQALSVLESDGSNRDRSESGTAHRHGQLPMDSTANALETPDPLSPSSGVSRGFGWDSYFDEAVFSLLDDMHQDPLIAASFEMRTQCGLPDCHKWEDVPQEFQRCEHCAVVAYCCGQHADLHHEQHYYECSRSRTHQSTPSLYHGIARPA